jgi:hypothetical protein
MRTSLQCTQYGTLCATCYSVVVFVYCVTVEVCTLNRQFFGRWTSSVFVVQFSSSSIFVLSPSITNTVCLTRTWRNKGVFYFRLLGFGPVTFSEIFPPLRPPLRFPSSW